MNQIALDRVDTAYVSGTAFNAAMDNLQQFLNSQQLSSGLSSLILAEQPLASDVVVGNLVYFDESTGLLCRAISRILNSAQDTSRTIQAPQSRVIGIVTASYTASTGALMGTVLIAGKVADRNIVNTCLGSTATPGTYYLSQNISGTATKTPVIGLRQPVLHYIGDGTLIIGATYMAHDQHQHASCPLLSIYWVAISQGQQAPEGMRLRYDAQADTRMAALGTLSSASTALFYKGALTHTDQYGTLFRISDQGILYTTLPTAPLDGQCVAVSHYPVSYGAPIVRSVESGTGRISVTTSKDGVIRLDMPQYRQQTPRRTPFAISAISDTTIVRTPVVTGLLAGPGIAVTTNSYGVTTVSNKSLIDSYIDATMLNLNGASQIASGLLTPIAIYARNTGFTMSMTVPRLPDDYLEFVCVPWVAVSQASAACTLNVQLSFIPFGLDTDQQSTIPTAVSTSISATACDTNKCYVTQAPKGISVTSGGFVIANISLDSSTDLEYALHIMRQGFHIKLADMMQDVNIVDNAISVTASIGTANQPIQKLRVIRTIPGTAQVVGICDASDDSSANTALGVAICSAWTGQQLRYIMQGIIQDPSLNFITGQTIYVGPAGKLISGDSQQFSTCKYVQQVGIAVSSDSMQVQIGTAVVTSTAQA